MKSTLIIASIFALAISTSCDTPKEVVSQTQHENQTIIHDIELISSDVIYPSEEALVTPGGIVIRTLEEWRTLKNQMNQINHETNGFDDLKIDFETEMVIGYFDEVQGSTGNTVNIESITERLNGLHVNHSITNNSEMGAEVINQPYSLVKMRKRNKEVIFAPTF